MISIRKIKKNVCRFPQSGVGDARHNTQAIKPFKMMGMTISIAKFSFPYMSLQ